MNSLMMTLESGGKLSVPGKVPPIQLSRLTGNIDGGQIRRTPEVRHPRNDMSKPEPQGAPQPQERVVSSEIVVPRAHEYNQACPCCNSHRTVVGTIVQTCRVCGDEEIDLADLPYHQGP